MGGQNALAETFTIARRFAGARSGNVAMMFGLVLIPLLLVGGMAFDLNRAGQTRTEIQEAADGALLRAARMKTLNPDATDEELTILARQIFNAALAQTSGVTITDFNIAYNAATEKFSLTLDGTMDTSLMRAVGLNTLDVGTFSEVKLGKPPYLEVVLALDNTGSMNDSGKLQSLKDSSTMLVESLFENPAADIAVGLVPFAQYVNVGAGNEGKTWMGATPAGWHGCVGSRFFPANTEDSDYTANPIPAVDGNVCPSEIHPLSGNESAMLNALDDMTANGWTYIAAGLAWGWRALSNDEPFTEGVTKEELEDRKGKKVLIVLTDGENTRAPTYPEHDSTDTALADDMTDRLCDAIKDDGIEIYAITFDVTDPLIKDLMESCGSSSGHYYDAANASDLASVFVDIATSLRNLSLSK